MRFNEIPGWCAGCKVSGFTTDVVVQPNFTLTKLFKTFKQKKRRQSVLVVSTNDSEVVVENWLQEHGFTQQTQYKNYLHNGRLTSLWTIQIPKQYWTDYY